MLLGREIPILNIKEKKKKIKIEEEKKLIGARVKEHEWTQAMTGRRLQRGGG